MPASAACPSADASDHHAAQVIAAHPEQGWVLLCNGIIRFDDDGELLTSVADPLRQATLETAGAGSELAASRQMRLAPSLERP